MKFSKEYINECDCPEIQGLRKELKLYDFYTFEYGDDLYPTISICVDETLKYKGFIWLPTSGQLDEEIVKVCKHNLWLYKVVYGLAEDEKEFGYDIEVYNADGLYWHDIAISYNTNPLIAKIKLLKQLLEEE